jgi:hydroxyacyl-ACP dehydratase HTD2-like protein with hotdog domain
VAGREDIEQAVDGWAPAPVTVEDAMDPGACTALAATLDREPPPPGMVPPMWQQLYFLHWPRTDALGPDGHPRKGDFLPPIPERTRMFVGGRLDCRTGLRTGVPARRHSEVTGRTVKAGRSGTMLFVTVRHEIEQGGKVALVDEHDLMYRSGGAAATPARGPRPVGPPRSDAAWQEPFTAGPELLFRYSALTANTHRIHYDQPYVTGVEGYPGLVVHGPLLAVLLAGLAGRRGTGGAGGRDTATLASMRYRFARPAFAGDHVLVTGAPSPDGAELAVIGSDGEVAATADVTYA